MNKSFVALWEANKGKVRSTFEKAHPENYKEVVTAVVQMLFDSSNEYEKPDPDRICEIDHGNYGGTLVYVIGSCGYQPDKYWFVKVYYGSCSGCDTLEGIRGWGDDAPTDDQVNQYMTLALHIIQGLKEM